MQRPVTRLIERHGAAQDTLIFAESDEWTDANAVQVVCEAGHVDLDDWR